MKKSPFSPSESAERLIAFHGNADEAFCAWLKYPQSSEGSRVQFDARDREAIGNLLFAQVKKVHAKI